MVREVDSQGPLIFGYFCLDAPVFQRLNVGKFCLSSTNRLGDISQEVRDLRAPSFWAIFPRHTCLSKPPVTDLFLRSGSK